MTIRIKTTERFDSWLRKLKNPRAKMKINARIKRLQFGNFGDLKTVNDGIFEMRIDEGQGYRIYLKNNNSVVVILLCGGDKSTQNKDIKLAKQIAEELGV
ncbi:TPA: type II toxin-antitoxin system RelE/ParE family toxin [Pasteurella multocida]|uniref:type II toxin-antitoxin system RelE/ParE family toxin n=1 Tax=Pasteurella multocida TaxID=747 RepID=UPI0009999091|nr:type II toxin-antitoxin system RelE/ParE family toxin [Pasteurella multocida]AWY03296.1 RelE/ParE family toxin [Pasteurella phage Pm86]MBE7395128.1 type II toxin-antitoxin system RelE/ParE family toxin [Pasteurella multocida]MCL7761665.1 type II toxin-antitoxin system RelE/ParE family toxin [Pasteurella multocida]MCL7767749.1 type II toxin-antitoxin system RelE/ParE family toxin [Pasteurella multocida]MCL7772536.1 type II toxin-antitoxin system RelE/ParE family toxin [Pasteurella multocida]